MFWFIDIFVALGCRFVNRKKSGMGKCSGSASPFKNTNLQYTVSSY